MIALQYFLLGYLYIRKDCTMFHQKVVIQLGLDGLFYITYNGIAVKATRSADVALSVVKKVIEVHRGEKNIIDDLLSDLVGDGTIRGYEAVDDIRFVVHPFSNTQDVISMLRTELVKLQLFYSETRVCPTGRVKVVVNLKNELVIKLIESEVAKNE